MAASAVSDLGAVREQDGAVRVGGVGLDRVPDGREDRVDTRACWTRSATRTRRARARFWELHGAPERLTIDVDATLITAHSEKEKAAGNYKHGYGFHPLGAYADETREALGDAVPPRERRLEHRRRSRDGDRPLRSRRSPPSRSRASRS